MKNRIGESATSDGASQWICLAATPVFAAMALATGFGGGGMADMAGMTSSPLDGMALMYLLMAVFHAAPWLKRIAQRQGASQPHHLQSHLQPRETEA